MLSWDGQGGDQHGDTAEKEDGAADAEEPAQQDEPVLVENGNDEPDGEQDHARDLAHLERPRDVGYVVQNDVGQWRVRVHVWDSIVDND